MDTDTERERERITRNSKFWLKNQLDSIFTAGPRILRRLV